MECRYGNVMATNTKNIVKCISSHACVTTADAQQVQQYSLSSPILERTSIGRKADPSFLAVSLHVTYAVVTCEIKLFQPLSMSV